MRWTVLVLALAIGSLAMQRPSPGEPEQYEGQHRHGPPPEDLYCSPKDFKPKPGQKMIECACKRKCTEVDPQNPMGPRYPIEDPACSMYCFQSRCECSSACET